MFHHFKAYISRINNMYSLLFLDKYFLRNRRRTVDSSASKSNIQYLGLKPPFYKTCSYKIDNFDYSYDKFMNIWFFYAGDNQIKEYIIANYHEVMNIITFYCLTITSRSTISSLYWSLIIKWFKKFIFRNFMINIKKIII
jgi:hypothetical protein